MKAITEILRLHRKGGLIEEATEALNRVVQGVEMHGGVGKLTITLTVKRATDMGEAVIVSDAVKESVPRSKVSTIFFVDESGDLSRNKTREPELPLHAVDVTPEEEEAVDVTAGNDNGNTKH